MAVVSAKDVQSRAQEALSGSPVYALRELHVEQHGDALVIHGLVSSFYHKQLAQEVIRTAAEGLEVVNSIQVR
ncbi:MAG: BON domain-containing protein [Planctomycetia bacterium]|nr:BON domain-containing protein [Planctomycetia bacterium]